MANMTKAGDPLTNRQAEVLAFVAGYQAEHGLPPTLREIRDHFGIKSPNGVNETLKQLVRKGAMRHHGKAKSRAYIAVPPPRCCPHCGERVEA